MTNHTQGDIAIADAALEAMKAVRELRRTLSGEGKMTQAAYWEKQENLLLSVELEHS